VASHDPSNLLVAVRTIAAGGTVAGTAATGVGGPGCARRAPHPARPRRLWRVAPRA